MTSPCRSCGHSVSMHERMPGTHGWVCLAAPVDDKNACACAACRESGAYAACACRCYVALKAVAVAQ